MCKFNREEALKLDTKNRDTVRVVYFLERCDWQQGGWKLPDGTEPSPGYHKSNWELSVA